MTVQEFEELVEKTIADLPEGFKKKIENAKMPPEAKEAALKELDRLSKMNPASAEYIVSRTYLDWLVSLPWSISTVDNLDIKQVKKVLDEDNISEIKKAKLLIQQKSKIMHNLSESESRQKMIAFLARRGFSWETISQVLKIN